MFCLVVIETFDLNVTMTSLNTRDVIVTFRSKVSIPTRQNTLGGVKFKHPYKHPFYTLIFTV